MVQALVPETTTPVMDARTIRTSQTQSGNTTAYGAWRVFQYVPRRQSRLTSPTWSSTRRLPERSTRLWLKVAHRHPTRTEVNPPIDRKTPSACMCARVCIRAHTCSLKLSSLGVGNTKRDSHVED